MEPLALLITIEPLLKCVIFTEELGPITIQSISPRSLDKPNIESLALVRTQRLASACRVRGVSVFGFGDFSEGEYEIPVFSPEKSEVRGHDHEIHGVKEVLAEIKGLRGIQERLLDTSLSTSTNPSQGLIDIFLSRSESIVRELISTIYQHRQKALRKSSNAVTNRSISGTKSGQANHNEYGASHNRSLRYYESLYDQCSKLQHLLHQNIPQHETSGNSVDLNEDLSKITIVYHDQANRSHELVAELHQNFPLVSPTWTTDLPIEFKPSLKGQDLKRTSMQQDNSKKETEDEPMRDTTDDTSELLKSNNSSGSIVVSFLYFVQIVSSYQQFWDEMDDIDTNLWVLEPSLPSRRSSFERRIAMSEGVGIHLTFDPDHPRSPPLSMRLSGTSNDIKELRKAYQGYVIDINKIPPSEGFGKDPSKIQWDGKISIRSNLELCFGSPLPSPASSVESEFVGECGICYSRCLPTGIDDDHQQSQFPNILCSNSNCSRCYHESCLLEWLQSLPNVKVRFDRIHGTCPYCCESISVKITESRMST